MPEEPKGTPNEIKETTEYLKCILSDDEVREYGIELARKHTEAEGLEGKKKSFNDQIKADISKVTADISGLSSKISNGYEFKDVECEEHYDYDEETVSIIRLDTGEVETSRKMNSNDLQRRMFPKEETEEEEVPEEAGSEDQQEGVDVAALIAEEDAEDEEEPD